MAQSIMGLACANSFLSNIVLCIGSNRSIEVRSAFFLLFMLYIYIYRMFIFMCTYSVAGGEC